MICCMAVNQLSFKVTSERSILVFPDNQAKHLQYDDQVVQTFYISHADVTELTQLLSQIARFPQWRATLARLYNRLAPHSAFRTLLLTVGPFFRIVSAKAAVRPLTSPS